MATQKQILANRANALRSTGPITPEGKKIASQNSTRHGMLAQTVVLEGESKDRFEEVLNGYIALIKPRSDAETALVETMTIARRKDDNPNDSEAPVEIDQPAAKEASETEDLTPAQPLSPHGPNSSQHATTRQPSPPVTSLSGVPRPREKL